MHEDDPGELAGTFGVHRGARYKTSVPLLKFFSSSSQNPDKLRRFPESHEHETYTL